MFSGLGLWDCEVVGGLGTPRILRRFSPLVLRGLSGVCYGFGRDSEPFLGTPRILK